MNQIKEQHKTQKLTLKKLRFINYLTKNSKYLSKLINELKENTDKQLNKIRKKMHEQNEHINEIETIKKNQIKNKN